MCWAQQLCPVYSVWLGGAEHVEHMIEHMVNYIIMRVRKLERYVWFINYFK